MKTLRLNTPIVNILLTINTKRAITALVVSTYFTLMTHMAILVCQ